MFRAFRSYAWQLSQMGEEKQRISYISTDGRVMVCMDINTYMYIYNICKEHFIQHQKNNTLKQAVIISQYTCTFVCGLYVVIQSCVSESRYSRLLYIIGEKGP